MTLCTSAGGYAPSERCNCERFLAVPATVGSPSALPSASIYSSAPSDQAIHLRIKSITVNAEKEKISVSIESTLTDIARNLALRYQKRYNALPRE
jgi:hypothetical protein